MATLEKIRQKGPLLTIVIGVAMLLFIIGMVDFNTIFGASRQNVAEIDGNDINIADYEKRIDEMTAFYKIEMQQSSLSDQYTEQIRTAVWNSIVKEQVLAKQCKSLGLVVTDKEFVQNLTGNNPHPMMSQLRVFYNPEKGGYDKDVLQYVVNAAEEDPSSDIAKYWSFVQRTVKNQILEDKYNALVGASININDNDAKYYYDANRVADIEYTVTPLSTIADSLISVSPKDLKKYYTANKNQYYRSVENRDIELIAFDVVPSDRDYEDIKAWIEGLKNDFYTSDEFIAISNQNSDESYNGIAKSKSSVDPDLAAFAFSGKAGDAMGPELFGNVYKMARIVETGITAPDSVKISHILVMEDTKEKTEALADSLIAAINGGSDFAAVAKQYSKAGTSANGGQLGWLREGDYDKDFSTACINGPVNKLFKYNMNGAIQIIKVEEKTKPVAKVKLCVLSRSVEASSQTYGQIFNEASQYMAQNNSLEKFESSADMSKGQFIRNFTISATDNRIADLKDSRQIIRWAFDSKAGKVADRVFECGDKFVVVALKSVAKEGYPSESEIEDQLKQAFRAEKKADLIEEQISAKLSDGLAATGSIKSATGISKNSQYVSGIGAEPEVFAVVSTMDQASPVKVVKGNMGVYAVKVVSTKDQADFNASQSATELANRRPYSYMIYKSIENESDIKDNRITFY